MAREQHIKVYRSTGSTPPTPFSTSANGPTFGELAFVDGLTSLYIGRSDGSVLWIGAQVTGGSVSQGLEYAVPTMKAVKDYVTGTQSGYFIVKGEDGLTHEIALTDTLTLTGGLGIDVVKGSDPDTIVFRAVTGSATEWGVLRVNSSGPLFVDTNGLNVQTNAKLFRLRDEVGNTEIVGYDSVFTLTGGRGIDVMDVGGTFEFRGVTATTATLGVASFNPYHFLLSNGAVSLTNGSFFTLEDDLSTTSTIQFGEQIIFKGEGPINTRLLGGINTTLSIDVGLASTSATGVASFDPVDFQVSASGVVQLNPSAVSSAVSITLRDSEGLTDSISGKDTITITGGQGIFTTKSALDTIAVRGITATTTGTLGVAAFNSPDFTISSGVVSLGTGRDYFTVRDEAGQTFGLRIGDTLNITGGRGVDVLRTSAAGVQTTDILAIQGATATATTLGVASFPTTYFTVLDGVVNFASAYQATGDTVTGPNAAITVTKSGRTATIDARLATDSLTGVARFSSSYFSVADGLVTLASAYQTTGDTVNGPNASLKITRDGKSITLDNRFATTSLTGVASFDSRYFDAGTTGHVRIIMVDGGTFT